MFLYMVIIVKAQYFSALLGWTVNGRVNWMIGIDWILY